MSFSGSLFLGIMHILFKRSLAHSHFLEFLAGDFNPFEKMLVKLDGFPTNRGENKANETTKQKGFPFQKATRF